MATLQLGKLLRRIKGQMDQAITHYRQPVCAAGRLRGKRINNLGAGFLVQKGQFDDAICLIIKSHWGK